MKSHCFARASIVVRRVPPLELAGVLRRPTPCRRRHDGLRLVSRHCFVSSSIHPPPFRRSGHFLPKPFVVPLRTLTTTNSEPPASSNRAEGGGPLEIREFLASERSDDPNLATKLYRTHPNPKRPSSPTWKRIDEAPGEGTDRLLSGARLSGLASHLLPAQYPDSVAQGYLRYAGFCFTSSIAGSASMVLSTQTLLLAVGVVGGGGAQAGVMAGALNWVMKDFMGQLGGVLFASQMGKTRAFDSDPKRWRMVSAMAMDGATLLEILSPLFPAFLVLPVASIANVGKNIGFLTASASRAALNQAMAITGNLGDVTAKSGSQSIFASLIGTSLGIGLSSLLAHDATNFALGFCGLSAIHQGCSYLSLRAVPLAHFNRQRLFLLLDRYISDTTVLKPTELNALEAYFPLTASDPTGSWLRVGGSLAEACPDRESWNALIRSAQKHDRNYLLIRSEPGGQPHPSIHLVFLKGARGEDLIRGMYHACLVQKHRGSASASSEEDLQTRVDEEFPNLLERIKDQGWKTDTEFVAIEDSHARRLQVS